MQAVSIPQCYHMWRTADWCKTFEVPLVISTSLTVIMSSALVIKMVAPFTQQYQKCFYCWCTTTLFKNTIFNIKNENLLPKSNCDCNKFDVNCDKFPLYPDCKTLNADCDVGIWESGCWSCKGNNEPIDGLKLLLISYCCKYEGNVFDIDIAGFIIV